MAKNEAKRVESIAVETVDLDRSENITAVVRGGKLRLEIDLETTLRRTSTGNSDLVASSHGWDRFKVNGDTYSISMNVVKVDKKKK
jgi:hypothetical protein